VEALQHRFIRSGSSEVYYKLETSDISATLSHINTIAQEQQVTVLDLSAQRTETGYKMSFRIHFSGRRHRKHHQRFFDSLTKAPQVTSLQQSDSKSGLAV
jgi:hypothetical protein